MEYVEYKNTTASSLCNRTVKRARVLFVWEDEFGGQQEIRDNLAADSAPVHPSIIPAKAPVDKEGLWQPHSEAERLSFHQETQRTLEEFVKEMTAKKSVTPKLMNELMEKGKATTYKNR